MEIQVAVEAQTRFAICGFELVELVFCQVFWERTAVLAQSDAFESLRALGFRFWVEGDELEVRGAFVADEAAWVEALAGG